MPMPTEPLLGGAPEYVRHADPDAGDEGVPMAAASAAYGGLLYLVTFMSFVLVRRHKVRKRDGWSPLSVVHCGWTQVAVIGGCLWWLQGLADAAPASLQHTLFPASQPVCWGRLVWDAVGLCLLASALFVKQYRYFSIYVIDNRRAWSWKVLFALCCVPYVLASAAAYWLCYDRSAGACGDGAIVRTALFAMTTVLLLGTALLVHHLRDPCMYFPNLVTSAVEVAGMVVLLAIRGVRLWSGLDRDVLVIVEVFARATIPPTLYAVAVGRVLWMIDDEEYCRWLEVLCEPGCQHHLLVTPPREREFAFTGSAAATEYHTGSAGGGLGASGLADTARERSSSKDTRSSASGSWELRREQRLLAHSVVPTTCASPDYTKAKHGDYFEADRLTKLLNAGDRDAVQEFVLTTNLCLLHTQDREGLAPIHRAAKQGHVHVMKFLLDMSCDPNQLSKAHDCALHYAAHQGSVGMMRLLLDAGANPNVVSLKGCTPLHCAVSTGSTAAVALLVEHGADPGLPTHEADGDDTVGDTVHFFDRGRMRHHMKNALMLAVELGCEEAVALMAQPACINAFCVHGLTPLLVAVASGHKAVAKALLQHNAEVMHMNPFERRNVFHYAAMKGVRSVYMLLKAWLPVPNDADADRRTLRYESSPSRSHTPDSADDDTTTWDSHDDTAAERLLFSPPPPPEAIGLSGAVAGAAPPLPPEYPAGARGQHRMLHTSPTHGGGGVRAASLDDVMAVGAAAVTPLEVVGAHRISAAFAEEVVEVEGMGFGVGGSGTEARPPRTPISSRYAPGGSYSRGFQSGSRAEETASDGGWCAVDLLPTLLATQDYLGRTPLHLAVLHNNFDLALQLVEDGCDVSIVDAQSPAQGALHWTARRYLCAMRNIPYERWDQYQRLLRVLQQGDEQRFA